MRQVLYVDPKDATAARLLAAVGYRGGKAVSIRTDDTITLSGTFWDGGSRSTYHAIELATGRTLALPRFNPPQFGGPSESPTVDIPAGVAIVECSVFCGKTMAPRITVRPENLNPSMLPAPCELTDDERTVLTATRSEKASYNGLTRQQRAARRGFPADRWHAASDALRTRGLLNKAGAITVAGRNALATVQS